MLNKKLGISVFWKTRSTSFDIVSQENLRNILKNIFLKQNLFISDVIIHEYPLFINIIFFYFPTNKKQYKQLLYLNQFLTAILTMILKKNVLISCSLSKNLYHNINILSDWLFLKLYNQPSNTKKLIKQLLKQYDTITK